MAAYLIVDITITDPEGFKEYQQAVPAIVEKHGGRYIVRGGDPEVLEGDWNPTRVVVLEFPNMATLKAWYGSDDYQKIIALRTDNSDGNVIAVEGH